MNLLMGANRDLPLYQATTRSWYAIILFVAVRGSGRRHTPATEQTSRRRNRKRSCTTSSHPGCQDDF